MISLFMETLHLPYEIVLRILYYVPNTYAPSENLRIIRMFRCQRLHNSMLTATLISRPHIYFYKMDKQDILNSLNLFHNFKISIKDFTLKGEFKKKFLKKMDTNDYYRMVTESFNNTLETAVDLGFIYDIHILVHIAVLFDDNETEYIRENFSNHKSSLLFTRRGTRLIA